MRASYQACKVPGSASAVSLPLALGEISDTVGTSASRVQVLSWPASTSRTPVPTSRIAASTQAPTMPPRFSWRVRSESFGGDMQGSKGWYGGFASVHQSEDGGNDETRGDSGE